MNAPTPLTPKEREVLYLLFEGYPTADIAERLTISPKTVKTHIENIYWKYEIAKHRGFRGLVAAAIKNGVLAFHVEES